jgi:hypothetical protein
MKKLLFLTAIGMGQFLSAQFPNILISTLNTPEEVAIAINPKNTNQIIAGANLDNAYRSNDAGQTWSMQTIACNAYGVWGDPVMIWDTANACYYIHLSNPNPGVTPGGTWVDRVVFQRSTNAGQTYTACTFTGKNGAKVQDKAWPVVNPYNNEMHVTWTQFDDYGSNLTTDSSIILYSKSSDNGNTWSTPKRISKFGGDCIDSDNTVEGAVPAIGPLGQIYVAWAGPQGLVFQKSLDNGITWLPQESTITTIPGGWDYTIGGLQRANGLPFTYCDLSNSPYKGTIYVNWSDQRNGVNDGDIWLVKSTDGGNTWSSPLRVNNDVPGKQQFMSAMTVDQVTGFVYILFYDRRNSANNNNTDVYVAISKDGGATFANYKVNSNTFTPTTNVFFGDYIGISAHNNVVRPIWMQLNGGNLSVYTALIDPIILGIRDAEPDQVRFITPKPNPFKTETTVDFTLEKNAELTIELIDVTGKVIKRFIDSKIFETGTHSQLINSSQLHLSAGIYYLVFYGEKSKYIKLVHE